MRKFLFAALLALISTPALAQTQRAWIAEFQTVYSQAPAPFARLPALVHQPVIDLTGGASKRAAAFNSATRYVRVMCEVQCVISGTASAAGSAIILPPAKPEYFGVASGAVMSVMALP